MPPASRNLPRVTYSFVLHVPFSHISEVCVFTYILAEGINRLF